MSKLSWANGKDPEVLFVCGLGSGFINPAPGTWGSVLGVVLWLFLIAPLGIESQLAVIVGLFFVGWWITQRVANRYQVHDEPAIVIDEIVGVWVSLLGVGVYVDLNWLSVLLGFGLFRLFDIWKPWPVRWADTRVPGALGVMLDDLLAGILALGVLHLSLFWL